MNLLYTLILWACLLTGSTLWGMFGQPYGAVLVLIGINMALVRAWRAYREMTAARRRKTDEQG